MAPRRDPRPYQIAVLSALLLYGVAALDFEVEPLRAAATLAAALGAQWLCTRLWRLPRFDPRSALISGLSLSLLLRTDATGVAVAAAGVAIASKFVLRVQGRHVWNPTCLALVAALAATDRAWVSAGQWGATAVSAFAVACLGMLVVHRSARSDVTFAFLGFHAAVLFGRALWLGDPLAIPAHALSNGALVVFAFFMISDPKTVPDSRPGRIAYAGCVAAAAGVVRFGLWEPNPLLWGLAACAPLVPLFDRWLPGERYAWSAARDAIPTRQENPLMRRRNRPVPPARGAATAACLALALALPWDALAFCGFYVAKADTQLFNRASQVVLVRDGDRTVITMANDFRGDPEQFAMVIPVPTFLERGQIHVGQRAAIEHLDAYTAPRLVEYFDADPCARPRPEGAWRKLFGADARVQEAPEAGDARAAGVTVEARYAVGEYEILILSAEESRGLAGWLRAHGYKLPEGAEPVLDSYLKQDMRFFVAKVDLAEHARLGYTYLRPLQVAYESPRFMLPIRLGTLNADGTQELFVYTLTREGRVETTNYRTTKLPSGAEVPVFVKDDFADFYRALFDEQVRRERMRTVFTEYAWDMAWCDPCAADPLSVEELRGLGVWWVSDPGGRGPKAQARDVFVTRLHLRYDREHFPADLVFQQTGDRSNFQGRYVVRHPWEGEATCPAAEAYRRELRERREREARTLASLTRWDLADVRRRMGLGRGPDEPGSGSWWDALWK